MNSTSPPDFTFSKTPSRNVGISRIAGQARETHIISRIIRGDLDRGLLLHTFDFARTKNRPRGSPIAYGRKAVRTQSAILDKNNPKPLLPLSGTVFLVRMVSIRTKNTVGARERAMSALRMRRHLGRRIYKVFRRVCISPDVIDAPNYIVLACRMTSHAFNFALHP
jgi:hypothetical protein